MPEGDRTAFFLVLLATVGFAFKGVVARLAFAEGASVAAVLVLRVALATPLFWLGARILRGGEPVLESRRDRALAMLGGATFLLAAACDFAAIARIGAGPSRVILFSFPGFVLLFDALRERSRPSRSDVRTFVIAWVGLLLVAAPSGLRGLHGDAALGAACALAGAILYAGFLVICQTTTRRLGAARFAAWSNTGSALALLALAPWILAPGDLVLPAPAWTWIATLVAVCTVAPFFAFFEGVRRLGASRASLLALVGPPLTIVAAWLILDESLTAIQIVGAALVVGAVAVHRLGDSRAPAEGITSRASRATSSRAAARDRAVRCPAAATAGRRS